MHIDPKTGWLDTAEYIPSPNCDERPADTPIDLLVIHGISLPPGCFGGRWIDALFTNTLDPRIHPYFQRLQGIKVSAHLLIRRSGELAQFVPFHRRAWHAGQSEFEGRCRCNDFSIGIELEGEDHRPYEDIQYERLVQVTGALMGAYPALEPARIVGHCDIAPDRKTDPGPAFDWGRFRQSLGNGNHTAVTGGRP